MPLHPVLPQSPFEKWGLDYVGLIKPVARGSQARYIIVATDYMTKWDEDKVVRKFDARSIAKFIYEYIITGFGCPIEHPFYKPSHHRYPEHLHGVICRKSIPCYPRGNGQVERTKVCEVKRTD